MMTSAQVFETSVNVTSNSASQDYTHPDDHNLPNYEGILIKTACFLEQFPPKTKSVNGVPTPVERFLCNFLISELLFYRIGYFSVALHTLNS